MSTTPEQVEPDLEQIEVPVHGVLAVEGVETGDRRKFSAGALTWRDLPLPLAWPKYSGEGHDGSSVVGRIETIERAEDGSLPWTGFMNLTDEADEVTGLVADKSLRGVSVDVDSVDLELQTRDGVTFDVDDVVDSSDVIEAITSGRISGATICPIPAFAEAYIALGHPQQGSVVASGDAVAAQSVRSILDGLALPEETIQQLLDADEADLPEALLSIAESEEDSERAAKVIDAAEKIRDLLSPPDPEGEMADDESGIPGLPELTPEEAARISEAAPEAVPDVLEQIAAEAGEGEKAEQLLRAAAAMREAIAGGQAPPEEAAAGSDEFRDVSQKERDDLEKEGKAMEDGSFPIANVEDLKNAIQAVGRAKDPDKARRHIKKRARALGETDLIPEDWSVTLVEFADLAPGLTEDGPGWLTHPVDTDRLRDYWVRGAGAAKIGWGLPGDFNRCRALTVQYVGPKHISGYCFTGDTEFLTNEGVKTFADTVGTSQMVLTHKEPLGKVSSPVNKGGYWVEAPIESFGEQHVLSVTLRRGKDRKVIRATDEHEWFVSKDAKSAARKSAIKVTTAELQPGMAMASLMPNPHAKSSRSVPSPQGVAHGMVYGDGSAERGVGATLDLWGEKDANLLPYFAMNKQAPIKIEKSGVLGVRVRGLPNSWKQGPSLDEGHGYLLGWLAGYVAADGNVSPGGAVTLSSARRESLELAAVVANRIGISTHPIRTRSREGIDGRESEVHKLTFVSETFPEAALLIPEHRAYFEAAGAGFTATRWVVEDVTDHGEAEEVFCAVVPETETFALADYVWTHNCANRHKDALGIWPGQHDARTVTASAGEPVAPVYRLVASGAPALPPMDWFANPGLQGPTPLTITEDGQVFGHVATWGTCHVGFEDSCVTAPTSMSEYAYFCSGVVATDGGDVRAGQITFDTGHAGLELNSRRTMAHYDNTGHVAADVMAGEDEVGIWVAGALRPGVDDDQIRTLRGAKMSGDWRSIGGNLEMVAVLAVNVPGFPIPRPALAASGGRQEALVAAGVVPEAEKVENFTVEEIVSATMAKIEADRRAREEIQQISASLAAEDIQRTLSSVPDMEV